MALAVSVGDDVCQSIIIVFRAVELNSQPRFSLLPKPSQRRPILGGSQPKTNLLTLPWIVPFYDLYPSKDEAATTYTVPAVTDLPLIFPD